MQKRSIFAVLIFLVLAAFLVGAIMYDQSVQLYSDSQFAMDTFMNYKLYGPNAEKAIKEIKDYVADLDRKLSLYSEDSEIAIINQNAGKDYVKVSEETFEILCRAKELCENSGGNLDITIAPLTKLWGITSDEPKVPVEGDINTAKELVNFKDILLDEENTSVKLKNVGQAIDLGGFAKGYACEKAVKICKNNGVKKGVISIGGNVAVIGKKPGGELIDVNITVPERNKIGYFATVELKDKIIATSGGYERYFEENGTTYEHILNPFSGYPVESELLSVSIISDEGILTDAMSTQLYIEGLDSVKRLLSDESIGIIAVDREKNVYVSNWLRDYVTLSEDFPDYQFAE